MLDRGLEYSDRLFSLVVDVVVGIGFGVEIKVGGGVNIELLILVWEIVPLFPTSFVGRRVWG